MSAKLETLEKLWSIHPLINHNLITIITQLPLIVSGIFLGLDGNEVDSQNWHGNRLQTIQSEKVKTIAGTLDPEIVQYTIQSSGGLIDCVLKE